MQSKPQYPALGARVCFRPAIIWHKTGGVKAQWPVAIVNPQHGRGLDDRLRYRDDGRSFGSSVRSAEFNTCDSLSLWRLCPPSGPALYFLALGFVMQVVFCRPYGLMAAEGFIQ